MLKTIFIVFALLVAATLASNWIACAHEGEVCHVPINPGSGAVNTTYNGSKVIIPKNNTYIMASFGCGIQFAYREFETRSNSFHCTTEIFGNPTYGKPSCSKSCYFRYFSRTGYSGEKTVAGSYYMPPELQDKYDGYLTVFNMGYADMSLTGYFMGKIPLESKVFGTPILYKNGQATAPSRDFRVYDDDLTHLYGTWHYCTNEGYFCELPNPDQVYSIMFGTGSVYTLGEGYYPDTWPSNIIREFSGSSIHCSTNSFPDMPVFVSDYPNNKRYCLYSIKTVFDQPIGRWKAIASCSNCQMTESFSFGYTSTSSTSKTESWSTQLAESTSASLHWGFGSASESLSTTTTHTITEMSMHAYTQQFGKTCSATCKTGYLWQWVINVNEVTTDGNVPFDVYTCNFLCRQDAGEPQCPLSSCEDDQCNECFDY